MKLSVVTTLYYSEQFIIEFYQRIRNCITHFTKDYEIIFVDDGSPDNSLKIALSLRETDKHIKIVELSRNFGHHKAMMTGLSHASGDYVFLIDCDLEEEPELLMDFYHHMVTQDCDVVYGVQTARKGNWFERYTGELYYRVINFLSGISFPKNIVTARLMNQSYVSNLIKHQEKEVFIAGLWHTTGFKQVSFPISKFSKGSTTYSFSKKLQILINSVTSFSNKPLIYIFYVGTVISMLSGVYIAYLVIERLFFSIKISGWTSLVVSIWFLGGLIIFFMGIIGIYLSKIFIETKDRPYSIIRNFFS